MARTLYQIGADLIALDELIEERNGDVTDPEVDAAITAWQQELATDEAVKLDGYIGYTRQLDMEIAACQAEEDQWRLKRHARVARRDRIKAALLAYFVGSGRTKATTAAGRTITVATNGGSTPVVLADGLDAATVPDELCVIDRRVNKDAVRERLEAGEALEFARLGERGRHLRVR